MNKTILYILMLIVLASFVSAELTASGHYIDCSNTDYILCDDFNDDVIDWAKWNTSESLTNSFSEELAIIQGLNLVIEEDAAIISEMNFTLEELAIAMEEFKLTAEEQLIFIGELELSLEREKLLVDKLKIEIEEKEKRILDLQDYEPIEPTEFDLSNIDLQQIWDENKILILIVGGIMLLLLIIGGKRR